jgi:hypothetical protein
MLAVHPVTRAESESTESMKYQAKGYRPRRRSMISWISVPPKLQILAWPFVV